MTKLHSSLKSDYLLSQPYLLYSVNGVAFHSTNSFVTSFYTFSANDPKFTQCKIHATEWYNAHTKIYVSEGGIIILYLPTVAALFHSTIIRAGIKCKKIPCYMRDLACR